MTSDLGHFDKQGDICDAHLLSSLKIISCIVIIVPGDKRGKLDLLIGANVNSIVCQQICQSGLTNDHTIECHNWKAIAHYHHKVGKIELHNPSTTSKAKW